MQIAQTQKSTFLGSKSTLRRQLSARAASPKVDFRRRSAPGSIKAFSEVNVVIGLSTLSSVLLGRYVFLPTHKKALATAGLPKQNGQTHADAGDLRAVEATPVTQFADSAGFTLVEAISYGALGHAIGYAILALQPFKVWPYNF